MQYERPLQVASMGSWQTSPSDWNLQFLQHALFLSLNTERHDLDLLLQPEPDLDLHVVQPEPDLALSGLMGYVVPPVCSQQHTNFLTFFEWFKVNRKPDRN